MLWEMLNVELAAATAIAFAAVTLPSVAFACLLTLWFGRRIRPTMLTTISIALGAALPWALWLAVLMLIVDGGREPLVVFPLLFAYLLTGLLGSVPAALVTRHAAVMPRGRRAEDR